MVDRWRFRGRDRGLGGQGAGLRRAARLSAAGKDLGLSPGKVWVVRYMPARMFYYVIRDNQYRMLGANCVVKPVYLRQAPSILWTPNQEKPMPNVGQVIEAGPDAKVKAGDLVVYNAFSDIPMPLVPERESESRLGYWVMDGLIDLDALLDQSVIGS